MQRLYRLLFVFVLITPSTKLRKFGRKYLAEGFSERDEIWRVDRGGIAVYQGQDWWTLTQGSLGVPKYWRV